VKIKDLAYTLDDTYQNFLFYKVWERKNKIMGIHPDFGRLSLFGNDNLSMNYHCDQEDVVDILLDVIDIIESFDRL